MKPHIAELGFSLDAKIVENGKICNTDLKDIAQNVLTLAL